ncbi:MAG TPA: 50S ribosomal protein L2 [Patescibacteria group bacterium]|nr:50S ribosomal protein L2 [Patescibacteria group bacterium]
MGIKKYKNTSQARRKMSGADFKEITAKKPQKSLIVKNNRKRGHTKAGISVGQRGGGAKRLFRKIDFLQNKLNLSAKVVSIEYDPNRTARIAQIVFSDGEKRYILAPQGLKVTDSVIFADKTPVKTGNRAKLKNLPTGTVLHNIELNPGRGGQTVRSAGASAQLLSKEGKYVTIQFPSREVKKVLAECSASIGALSFPENSLIKIGKAGRKRWQNIRPKVRGVAMSPNAHPHGGGEGRSSVGMPSPKTPWGKPTKGYKTRKRQASDRLIVKKRK